MKPRIVRKKGHNPLAELFQAPPSAESEATYRNLLITHRILELMEEKGVSRSELAARMGVQPSRVTAMLSWTGNLTIDTLVRAGMALDAELHQTFVPVGTRTKRAPCKYPAGPQPVSRVAEDPAPYLAKKKP